jgi:riboflavin synthase
MFSGLVEGLMPVVALRDASPGKRLTIDLGPLGEGVLLGDSIATNGCCLTVVALEGSLASFEAGPETLAKTNLGRLAVGRKVNVERSLRLGDRLGGHLVTGHVDGVGRLDERRDEGDWSTFRFGAPPALMRQMASKGSVAVDGVSLTLVDVTDEQFSVALIPFTLAKTTLGGLVVGATVNLETDLLAKYVERQLHFASQEGLAPQGSR